MILDLETDLLRVSFLCLLCCMTFEATSFTAIINLRNGLGGILQVAM